MREWSTVEFDREYKPSAGDMVRLTITGRVRDVVSAGDYAYGVQFTSNGGTGSHTVYLNQDDVTVEVPKPPKPEEPTGLGAVVEDEAGTKWLRHDSVAIHRRWLNTDDCDTRYRAWDEIDVVRVLSEGVPVE